MYSNNRSWSLVAGALIILAACIFAYFLTRPAEADVASLINMLTPFVPWTAYGSLFKYLGPIFLQGALSTGISL